MTQARLNNEQIDALYNNLHQQYLTFARSIESLPLAQENKVNILFHINNGYLWLKESISSLRLNSEMTKEDKPKKKVKKK